MQPSYCNCLLNIHTDRLNIKWVFLNAIIFENFFGDLTYTFILTKLYRNAGLSRLG